MGLTPVIWLERGPVKAAKRPAVPEHWCRCEGKGTCMGCVIIDLIQKYHGTAGVLYLLDAIKAGEHWGGVP